MTTTPAPQDDVLAAIAADGPRHRRRRGRLLAIALLAAAAAAAFVAVWSSRQTGTPQFRTEGVTRGDLTVIVSATGNLQPINQVDVGSEVSGLVESVFVDDNDHVKTGQVLARLDVSKLQDQVINARAALASAEAGVQQAVATVKESQASLGRLRQVAELSGGKVPSKTELETAEATEQRAISNEAAARAAVEQAQATLSSAEINLRKASIRSPIDGIVLSREIEPGQTVAASFTAPVLFTLAEDLSQMELEVDVDEADVGQVRDGLAAEFTVDAYPTRRYPARIARVSFGSTTKDNVVFYKAILTVNNDDLTLRPGMTATAEIVVVRRTGVLLVPNAALRFTPPTTSTTERSGGVVSYLFPRPPDRERTSKSDNVTTGAQRVWILRDGAPVAVPVTVGPTDGRVTEVTGTDLSAGTPVITESTGATS